jgi:translation initiation factor eIF-2B subunit gamma
MYKAQSATSLVPSTDPKNQEEDMSAQIVGLDEETGRIVYVRMRYAVQSLSMNKAVLRQFPNISFKSDLQQAHVYLMSPSILNLLQEQTHISSIQADLLPYVVTAQTIPEAQDWAIKSNDTACSPSTSSSDAKAAAINRVSCYAYMVPENVFLERANNLPMYIALNFRVASDTLPLAWPVMDAAAGVAACKETCRTAALNECLVGDSLKLEPCTLNRVIVGNHCRLGKGVRVTNSVLMDHVTLEPGAQVSDSIVCERGVISAKAILKHSRVASGCVVPAGAVLEKESFQDSGVFENDDDEDEEDL